MMNYGISDATYYNWKAKYAGLTVSKLKRLKALEEENRRLKLNGEECGIPRSWRQSNRDTQPRCKRFWSKYHEQRGNHQR